MHSLSTKRGPHTDPLQRPVVPSPPELSFHSYYGLSLVGTTQATVSTLFSGLHNDHNIHEKTSPGDWVALLLKNSHIHKHLGSDHWTSEGAGFGLVDQSGMGPVSIGQNPPRYLVYTQWSIIQSQPAIHNKTEKACLINRFSESESFQNGTKMATTNTATQSKGHSMRLPWVHTVCQRLVGGTVRPK